MKAITALFILSLIFLASSQDCLNPLISQLNITNPYTTPTQVTGLQYCTNLETPTGSCCSTEYINQLQNITTNVTSQIQALAGFRDLDLSETQDNILPNFQTLIDEFNNQLDILQSTNQTAWNILNKAFKQFKSVAPSAQSTVAHLNNTLKQLQGSRVACYQTMLLVQAAAYCLACDPEYAENGVNTNGSINLSATLCTQMQNNCYPFIADSAAMSVLLTVQQYSALLQQGINYMMNLSSGVVSFPASTSDVPIFVTPTGPGGKKQKKVSIPNSCTAGNCPWICSNLFQQGVLNFNNLAAGGAESDTTDFEASSSSSDDTPNNSSGGGKNKAASRLLQTASTWDFDPVDVGATVVVSANPADVSQPLSAVIHFGSIIVMLAVLLTMLF
jgi:hypothetical protein